MTKVIGLCLAFVASVGTAQTTATDVSGKWAVTTAIAGNSSDQDCTFTQSGADFFGTCKGDQSVTKITGKVDGNKVSWSYKTSYNDQILTLKYEGTATATAMSGTATVEEFGVNGDFRAVKPGK